MADILERLISLVARDALAEHGRVLTHDALLDAVVAKGAGTVLDEVPREVIDDILGTEGNGDGPLVELGDGRVVDATDRFDGLTLPHVLTAAEQEADALAVHPDLSVLADLGSADGGLHLPDGTPLRLVAHRRTPPGAPRSTTLDHQLRGPAGWLADLPVGPIGVTVDDGFVRLAAAEPAAGAEADRVLAASAEGAKAAATAAHPGETHDGMPRSIDLLQCAGLVDGWWQPAADGPAFGDVLEAAGLERRTDMAGAPGCWERWDELNVTVGRLSRHRYLEDEGMSAFIAAHTAWTTWQSDPSQTPPVRVCRTLHLHTDLPAALLDELRRDDPEGDDIEGFLAALPDAGGPVASGPLTLRAAWALAQDQITLAEELATKAVAADPEHHAAVDLLAELAADRGDLARVVALLRTVRTDEDPELALQQRRLRSLDPQVGRNEPCPCGSGRKYKQCHLGRMDLPTADLVALAVEGIRDHLVRTVAPGTVDALVVDIEIPEGAGEGAFAVATDALIFDGGGIDRYLAARRDHLPPDRLALVERWASEHRPGLFRVQGIDAGGDLTLVDHASGEELPVGRSASFDVVTEGQLVWCRLLPAADRWWTAGIVRPVADHEIEAVAAREDATDPLDRVRALLAPDLPLGAAIRRADDGEPWVWCHSMITHDLEPPSLLAAIDTVLPRAEQEDDDPAEPDPGSLTASMARWRILVGAAEVGRVTTMGDAVIVAAESIGPFDRTLAALTEALTAAGGDAKIVSERRLPDARDEVLTADEELLDGMFEDL